MAAMARPSPSSGSASHPSAAAATSSGRNHPSSSTSLRDFWLDDYAPLQWAGTQVLACLRDDEAASNADLYRRISGGSGGGGGNSHTSGTVHGSSAATTSQTSASSSSTAAAGQPAYELNFGTVGRRGGSTGAGNLPSTRVVVPQLRHLQSIPLPEPLQDALRTASRHSFMGLLPGAHLAWLSVDDVLWLWGVSGLHSAGAGSAFGGVSGSTTIDSEPSQPLCQFKVPSGQPIVAVGLVKPKPGVFVVEVEWCVVVTTPNEVLLCALHRPTDHHDTDNNDNDSEYDDSEHESMDRQSSRRRSQHYYRFVPTMYSVHTDCAVLSVTGTHDGRIFLGGDDGSLSELVYQSPIDTSEDGGGVPPTLDGCLRDFYDCGKSVPAILSVDHNRRVTNSGENNGRANPLQRWGKRAWDALAFGSTHHGATSSRQEYRSHKRAKLHHHRRPAGATLSAFVPDAISRFLVGGGGTAGGARIVQLTVDPDRDALYALSSDGAIAVHDLRRNENPQVCRLDVPRVARSYLEAVARGQLYAPPGASFPGGDSAAQSGVGGMEGARQILRAADFGGNHNGTGGRGTHSNGRTPATAPNVLHPVAIHVIPPAESQRLTLVAVTAGGLRLYLSSLAPAVLSSGPTAQAASRYGGGGAAASNPRSLLAPRALTLCHIRAPPTLPGLGSATASHWPLVDATFCRWGTFVAAVDRPLEAAAIRGTATAAGGGGTAATTTVAGNVLVAMALDAVERSSESQPDRVSDRDPSPSRDPAAVVRATGGMTETVTLPMDATDGVLPGGIVWEIADFGAEWDHIEKLTLMSQTPTDAELSVGPPPPFLPPSKLRVVPSKGGLSATARDTSEALARPASFSSIAMAVLRNALTNIVVARPLRLGFQFQLSQWQNQLYSTSGDSTSMYRVSKRSAVDGFSATAAESTSYADRPRTVRRSPALATARSVRLRAWLLRPPSVSLNQLATLHLAQSKRIVALNAGGLHYFGLGSILSRLADALLSAGENVHADAGVSQFFYEYGYKEGCAMCLALCIGCEPSVSGNPGMADLLRRRAKTAALARAYLPRLLPTTDAASERAGTVVNASQGTTTEPLVPLGYDFHPSELSRGVLSLFARLVRPVWFKPAVVVTEGRVVKFPWSRGPRNTPAKVELLLSEDGTEALRKPLSDLLKFMAHVFAPAVKTVPGGAPHQGSRMEVDDEDSNVITRALQYNAHRRAVHGSSIHFLSPSDADAIARLVEEKNLHCLYRLLSRVVQLLNLLSLLRRAQKLPELNEVEWGLLHGLTVSQLVQTPEGQERLESLLNTLVTASIADGMTVATPSAQSDQLAMMLSTECYLFFSPGSRSAYLGFRYGNEALRCPDGSERRASLSLLAADHLRSAAQQWYSAPLVSGRILHNKGNESVEQVALRAVQHGSPLARAVDVLVGLGDVASAVEVCLITATNFKDSGFAGWSRIQSDVPLAKNAFPWEHTLYHKRKDADVSDPTAQRSAQSSPNKLVTYGANVSASDAINTCYALIFYQLSELLKSQNPLSNNMVSACAASTDPDFLSALFLFLLQSGHKDTLLRVDSTELEGWLGSRQDPELLWSYYNVQGRFYDAGKVSLSVAGESGVKRSLSERIDWLRRTVADLEAAKDAAPPHDSLRISHERDLAHDRLRIAQIQNRILSTMSTQKTDLTAEQMDSLSYSIIPVTELYNDYADHYGLFEQCLLLLHACEVRDNNAIIVSNWKGVFCEEILPCATRNEAAFSFLQSFVAELNLTEDVRFIEENQSSGSVNLLELGHWVGRLEARVARLGKELNVGRAAFMFPVQFIFGTLIDLAGFVPSLEPNWALMVLVQAEVPYLVVLDAYMTSQAQRSSRASLHRVAHIACAVDLVEHWIRRARTTPIGGSDTSHDELRQAVASGRLHAMLGALQGQLEPTPDSAGLLQRITDVEDRLQFLL